MLRVFWNKSCTKLPQTYKGGITIMTAKELVSKCLDTAKNYKTLYVMGCFGAPMTVGNKARYTKNHPFNALPERSAKILAAAEDTFGFDCVCFIKALLWGWSGDESQVYGGAVYKDSQAHGAVGIECGCY